MVDVTVLDGILRGAGFRSVRVVGILSMFVIIYLRVVNIGCALGLLSP